MRERRFGRLGWSASEIGYGAWQIGGSGWGDVADAEAAAVIEAALEAGIDFFDTALAYGEGRSERRVSQALQALGARDRVKIATKIPPKNRGWPARDETPLREAFPADYIRECAETSLRNIGRPIDLLQLHVWADAWTDDDEWYDALSALKEEGKIHGFGVSVNSHQPDSAVRVTRTGRIDSLQVIYNVFEPMAEDALFPAAREHDVAVIARVPLDEGSLAGAYTKKTRFPDDDFRSRYFGGRHLRQTLKRVERVRPLLESPDQSMAQGALRFCLGSPAVSTVIVGTTRPAHIRDNAGVSELGPLDADTLEALRAHAWPDRF